MTDQPKIALNDGHAIPQLGFGTWRIASEEAPALVGQAITIGYRAIDTAAAYGNEEGVGQAIDAASLARDDLFITTKLGNSRHGYDAALRAAIESLHRMNLGSVDLYLIHWPMPRQDLYVETWRALIKLMQEGYARSIGVSNFTVAHLRRLIDETGVVPAVNQIELHPRFQQRALREFHAERGIMTQSWSPLGRGKLLEEPAIRSLAERHGKTPAQILLRWHVDCGLIVIPKSATPARIKENFDILDFRLAPGDMDRIGQMDDPHGRIGPDPENFE